jgi:hypothetical protein
VSVTTDDDEATSGTRLVRLAGRQPARSFRTFTVERNEGRLDDDAVDVEIRLALEPTDCRGAPGAVAGVEWARRVSVRPQEELRLGDVPARVAE